VLAAIEALLGLDGNTLGARLHYADARRGQHRTVRLSGSAESMRLEGFLLAGDIAAEAWIRPLLQEELPAAAYGRSLLVAGRDAPVATPSRGRQVCTCFDVSEREIVAALAGAGAEAGASDALLRFLQAELKCGTQCGSCLPEVRRLVRNAAPGAAVPQEVSAATIP
jgi:assimilatory nitrate reductase catalytic subunit